MFHSACSPMATSEADQREREPSERVAGADGEPDADAERGGEHRVGERAHHPAPDEGADRGRQTAVQERAAQVEDVLREREAQPGQPGVDDAVDHAVELAAADQQDADHGQPLGDLLHHRGHEHRARLLRGAGDDHRPDAQDQGDHHGRRRAPRGGEEQQRARLVLQPVEPEQRRGHRVDRQQREQQADQGAGGAGAQPDDDERGQRADAEDEDDHHPQHDPAGAGPGGVADVDGRGRLGAGGDGHGVRVAARRRRIRDVAPRLPVGSVERQGETVGRHSGAAPVTRGSGLGEVLGWGAFTLVLVVGAAAVVRRPLAGRARRGRHGPRRPRRGGRGDAAVAGPAGRGAAAPTRTQGPDDHPRVP